MISASSRWISGQTSSSARENDPNGARPCLVLDKCNQHLRQIVNDMRQNRPSIKARPVDDAADKDTAEVYSGLIRHIENRSGAEVAYLTGGEHAAAIGRGFFRILTEYEHENSFSQEIEIARIHNPFSVYFDPYSTELDGADAEFAFVTDRLPKKMFERQFPDAEPVDIEHAGVGDLLEWYQQDSVRIAEYFYRTQKSEPLLLLASGETVWGDAYERALQNGIEPVPVVQERQAHRRRVQWCKHTGSEILERREFPSSYIPVIPVYGNQYWLEGERRIFGAVRAAKDPQRAYNYWAPLALDTPLPTPSGWTTMGDVKKGDVLFDDKGLPCKVLGTSPVYSDRECFNVVFDDGTNIVADAEHFWTVEERVRGGGEYSFVWVKKTLPTAQLQPKKHFIYLTRPLDVAGAPLPIDPYYLGVWLGDGDSINSVITSGAGDVDEMRQILKDRGLDVGEKRKSSTAYRFTVHGVCSHLKTLGLLGSKRIPAEYLRGSFQQRLALLQGLMDTDGSITKKTGQCSFTTVSQVLRDGFAELLRSLGLKAVVIERPAVARKFPSGRTYMVKPAWQFSFSPRRGMELFRLSRKAAVKRLAYHDRRTGRFGVKSIERTDSVPVKCVAVDNESHLFLAGISMVPTHNSQATELIALAPRAPYIGAAGQFEGYESKWGEANTENFAFLEYNPQSIGGVAVPPPQRQAFAGVPAGVIQQLAQAEHDIQAALGQYNASLGAPSNEHSGVAIRQKQMESDMANSHYMHNLARSIEHAGYVLIEMIPKVYDTARTLRILGEDGSVEQAQIDPSMPQAMAKVQGGYGVQGQGKAQSIYNLNVGRYDVAVTVGPGYSTRRQEAAEGMVQLAQANPQMMQLAGDLMVRNMDWPGADQIADRLKRAIPPEIRGPEEGEEGADIPPEIQARVQQMQQHYEQQLAQAQEMIEGLQQQDIETKAADTEVKGAEVGIKRFDAETKRLELQMKVREGDAQVAQTEAQTAQVQGQADLSAALLAQAGGEREVLGSLIEATQGMAQTVAALSEAAAAMSAGMNAPKRIEIVRDQQGRAAGAVVVPGMRVE